jgi:hypothetical protein
MFFEIDYPLDHCSCKSLYLSMVSVGRGSILLLPKQVEGDEFD